jgi:hypothetical protein
MYFLSLFNHGMHACYVLEAFAAFHPPKTVKNRYSTVTCSWQCEATRVDFKHVHMPKRCKRMREGKAGSRAVLQEEEDSFETSIQESCL